MASVPSSSACPSSLGLLAEGQVREVILATNSTVEGEATAHFIGELVRARGIAASRIAHGVPFGGELEYVDGGTLAHALQGRHHVTLSRRGRACSVGGALLPEFFVQPAQAAIAFVAARVDRARLHGRAHGAVRFLHVAAVLEATG